MNKATIQGSLASMNTFVQVNDDRYRLKNMNVYEAILLSFGENFPYSFLELVNKNDVFTYVRSHNYKSEKWEICVHLEDDMTEALARKLIDMYAPNTVDAYTDIYKHPSFNDGQLVSCFLDIVEKDVEFRPFLDSFVAGACNYKNDKLACETIKRFSSLLKFDFRTFDSYILHRDLFETFQQYMNDLKFRKLLMTQLLKENSRNSQSGCFFTVTFSGSRRCFLGMLDFLLNRNNDLETDGDIRIFLSTKRALEITRLLLQIHCEPMELDWSEVIAKLTELLASDEERQVAYRYMIKYSLEFKKFDVAEEYLKKVVPFTILDIFIIIPLYRRFDDGIGEFLNLFCKMIKALNSEWGPVLRYFFAFFALRHARCNEKMVMKVLHEFDDQCDYTGTDEEGSTILHVCEENQFSDANLLFILQRAEGEYMFTSVNDKGLTPVQCRESYERVKKFWSTRGHRRNSCPRIRRFQSRENLYQYYNNNTWENENSDSAFIDDMQIVTI